MGGVAKGREEELGHGSERAGGLKRAPPSGQDLAVAEVGAVCTGPEGREDIQPLSGHKQYDFPAPPTVFLLSCFWTKARHRRSSNS